ncbi:Bombesin receptor subtype-3 [Folsomia candida]|uniref:Bombesin receptor subtype-3 n=1 Tax=Folsomia candida TaxID=158441 RepID=A0A226E2K5_FOLCA|nr:Bombesin receptor subtype-3 [Folsomia candida]
MDDAVLMEDILTTNVTTSLSPTPPSFGDESSFSTKFANDTLDYVPYSARPETYIVSLAVGDLFVILFCVPFTSTVYTVESWPYGEFVCKFSEFIKDLSIGVSVFTLTALSADRYFAIVMVMSHFLVYYAIPLLFIGTFYIIMARHLILSTRNMPGEAQGQAKQIQARKKVAKMILSFVVIFAICFFPSHLFLLWFYFYPESEYHFNEFWNACRITGFCLSFINSCINPITLYCVSGTFRKTVVLDLPDAVRLDLVAVVSLFPVLDPCCLVLEGITVSEMDTYATLPHNHSTTLNITTNPTSSSANVSFPLTHHPYQKDYQEYLNRINALEKGDSPPRVRKVDNSARRNVGNVTKTKLAKTNWKSEEEIIQEQNNETEVTSFINLKKTTTKMSEGGYYHGSDSGCSEDCNVDEANVDSPLMNRAKVEGKGEKIALG